MDPAVPTPWKPDRRWADPVIALLTSLALLAAGLTLWARGRQAKRPAERTSFQGRLLEIPLAASKALGTGSILGGTTLAQGRSQLREPWDQALLSVLAAESGDLKVGRELARAPEGGGGDRFRAVWAAAYEGAPLPEAALRREAGYRLGHGYSASLLEARLLDREGSSGESVRRSAREALLRRTILLGAFGLGVFLVAAGGLVFGIFLLVIRRPAPPNLLPAWGLSGRGAILVFLTWFLLYFCAGNLTAILLLPWPSLRWVGVPLSYLLHAGGGMALICKAEGLTVRELARRLLRPPVGRNLAWGGAFLALALFLVVALAILLGPILKPDQSPQRELLDLLRGLQGWVPTLVMFLTVAGLVPLYEELLFRGFLLPVLARRWRPGWALVVTALLFGAIHLQPAGLPTLAALGLAMGLAMRHTGSLLTPLLVHATWNGAIFLLMRGLSA